MFLGNTVFWQVVCQISPLFTGAMSLASWLNLFTLLLLRMIRYMFALDFGLEKYVLLEFKGNALHFDSAFGQYIVLVGLVKI